MATSAPSVPTMTGPRPTRARRTGSPNSGWGMHTSASTGQERSRLLWVAILSIPSWLLAVLYAVCVGRVMSTEMMILDMGLVQALTWLGLFAACTTVGAFILTTAAKLRNSVPAKTQRMMWALTTLSMAGWVYIWVSLSMMVSLPPLLPF